MRVCVCVCVYVHVFYKFSANHCTISTIGRFLMLLAVLSIGRTHSQKGPNRRERLEIFQDSIWMLIQEEGIHQITWLLPNSTPCCLDNWNNFIEKWEMQNLICDPEVPASSRFASMDQVFFLEYSRWKLTKFQEKWIFEIDVPYLPDFMFRFHVRSTSTGVPSEKQTWQTGKIYIEVMFRDKMLPFPLGNGPWFWHPYRNASTNGIRWVEIV